MTDQELRAIKHLVSNAYLYLDSDEYAYEIRDYNLKDGYFTGQCELTRDIIHISFTSVNLETDTFYKIEAMPVPEDLTLFLENGKNLAICS